MKRKLIVEENNKNQDLWEKLATRILNVEEFLRFTIFSKNSQMISLARVFP